MVKMYVLDTNVLIHDPFAFFNFEENEVVVPIYVMEEIDKLKKDQNEVGRVARQVARNIDKLRERGSISEWVPLKFGGFFKVELKGDINELPDSLKKDVIDNRIIAVAKHLTKKNADKEVILVTKDINMRIKADALAIKVQDYVTNTIEISEFYSGEKEIEVEAEVFDKFKDSGKLKYDVIMKKEPKPNEFFDIILKDSKNKRIIGMYNAAKKRLEKLKFGNANVWGIRGKNKEQECALELLMNNDIKLVTLVGKAGTGKTLIALATGLEQVVERELYKKLIVARPIMPMGKDIGYLPGGEKEKLRPWMQPIYDNFEFLNDNKGEKDGLKIIDSLESFGLLKIEALTYIRGRSIPSGFIIIDEAQNLTPHEIKTIVTRAGENTKIVFTGDPYQIDNPYLDANSNGLTYLAEKLKGEEISGHITLTKGERSALAEIASKLL